MQELIEEPIGFALEIEDVLEWAPGNLTKHLEPPYKPPDRDL
jgi:hypothetical protein